MQRTINYVEKDGNEFETRLEPIDRSELVTIFENRAIVSYLSHDEITSEWYFDDNECGRFITFDNRRKGEHISKEEAKDLINNNPRAFLIDYFEHGLCRYSRAGASPADRWDTSRNAALFVVPDDASDPEKYCDSVMEEFTNWCNGNIYGICHAQYVKKGDEWENVGDDDECWGYIGLEYAEKTLKEEHESQDFYKIATTKLEELPKLVNQIYTEEGKAFLESRLSK